MAQVFFALILFVQAGATGPAVVRVGIYKSYSQCVERGKDLAKSPPIIEHFLSKSADFRCVAVNG